MATFSVPGSLITANVLKTSPSASPNQSFTKVEITLVDTNAQWGTVVDDTRHIKQWGLQQSFDGGANWEWGPMYAGDLNDSTKWLPFGTRFRWSPTGAMPSVSREGPDVLGSGANARLRLAIMTDANVRLGASIVLS